MRKFIVVLPLIVGALLLADTAAAQVLGRFQWQQTPHCNVVTLTVTAAGGVFRVDGFDDNCGASTRSAVSGIAFVNPNGSVGMGLTLVTTPGAAPVHLDVVLSVSTLGGTWRDDSGNTGPWTFTPGSGSGRTPRPAPRPLFAAGLSAGGTALSNVGTPTAPGDATPKSYVDSGLAAERAYARSLATSPLTVSAHGAGVLSGSLTPIGGGCAELSPGALTAAVIDLPLPIGATVTAVRLRYVDSSSAAIFFFLLTNTFTDGGFSFAGLGTPILTSSNGVNGERVETVPVTTDAVAEGRIKQLYVTASTHTGSLFFCGADVLFTVP